MATRALPTRRTTPAAIRVLPTARPRRASATAALLWIADFAWDAFRAAKYVIAVGGAILVSFGYFVRTGQLWDGYLVLVAGAVLSISLMFAASQP